MNNKENSSDDDWLEAMLKKPDNYIEDDGFTDLVMQALPPAKKYRAWLEPVLVLSAAIISSLIAAYLVFPDLNTILHSKITISTSGSLMQPVSQLILGQSVLSVTAILVAMGIGMGALSWYLTESKG